MTDFCAEPLDAVTEDEAVQLMKDCDFEADSLMSELHSLCEDLEAAASTCFDQIRVFGRAIRLMNLDDTDELLTQLEKVADAIDNARSHLDDTPSEIRDWEDMH